MIDFLNEQTDDRPFLAYLAFTSPHDPLQVPDADLDRCAGWYDDGYNAIRRARTDSSASGRPTRSMSAISNPMAPRR